jgi:uroporphyrinogen decarboxylase
MTSKDRVLTAIAHAEPDRVPLNYIANPEIDRGLWAHFGLAAGDHEGLRLALGVDLRVVGPRYIGPPMPDLGPDRIQGLWGTRMRRVGHGTGEYWDYAEWLLKDAATVEEIEAFPWHPTPDMFDYSVIPDQIAANAGYAIVLGGAGVPDLLNGSGMVYTPERVLMDLALEDPCLLRLFDIRTAFHVEWAARCLEAAAGGVDLFWMGDDFGSQRGPLISMAAFRKHIRPRHEQVIAVVKAAGLPVMLHSCGSTRAFMPDLIEMGVNVMDTLQPEAADMDPADLKAVFGDQLAFHGMISTAGAVATGGVADVEAEVTERLETMMPGGGYLLAPTHALQSNSPIENVVAMYETARRVGVYG